MSLRLDWCSYEAAKYAVEHWHYSKCMPIGKVVKIGVWEGSKFIGCVMYSTGASAQIHRAYGVSRFEIAELVRVALNSHKSPVSKIVAISIKLLKKTSPKLKVLVSFADPEHDHHGGIYQAGNWVYVGESTPGVYFRLKDGTITHNRNLMGPKGFSGTTKELQKQYTDRRNKLLDSGEIAKIVTKPKYKYLYPLTDDMRSKIEPLRKPYPKRASVVHTVEQPAYQQGEGGSIPTLTHTATGKEPERING